MYYKNRHVLTLVQTSLVSNGVHRRIIAEAVQAVLDDERTEDIRRATQRASERARKLAESLADSLAYDIKSRSNDHQMLVNSDEYINQDNAVVSYSAVTDLPDYSYNTLHGLIPARAYTQRDPLVYNGQCHWGQDADRVVRNHNASV